MLRPVRLLLCVIALLVVGCGSSGTPTTSDAYVPPLLPFEAMDGYWGFMDRKGAVVVSPQFSVIEVMMPGDRARVSADGFWGHIGPDGELLTGLQWEAALRFTEGRAGVMVGGKWGFIDLDGKPATPLEWDFVTGFASGRAGVRRAGLWGYIDRDGTVIVPPKYAQADRFVDGVTRVTEDNELWSMIDSTGARIGDRQYSDISMGGRGLMAVRSAGLWGFVNLQGEMVIEPAFKHYYPFSDGRCVVGDPAVPRWWVIDRQGAVVVEPDRYDFIRPFTEGLAAARAHGATAYVDTTGTEVIAPMPGVATQPFTEGLAGILKDGKWGYMDRTGSMVVDPIYDTVFPFNGGLAMVQEGSIRIYIDHKGKVVFDPRTSIKPGS